VVLTVPPDKGQDSTYPVVEQGRSLVRFSNFIFALLGRYTAWIGS